MPELPCRRACGVQIAEVVRGGIGIADTGMVGERLDRLGQPSAPSVFGAAADEPAADRDPAGDHRHEPPMRGRDRQGMGEARARGGGTRSRPRRPPRRASRGSRCSRPAARPHPSRPRRSRSPGERDGQTTGRRGADGLVDGDVAIDLERHGQRPSADPERGRERTDPRAHASSFCPLLPLCRRRIYG